MNCEKKKKYRSEYSLTLFHYYVDPDKLNRNPWGRGRRKKKKRLEWEREPKYKRLLKTENKLRVDGGWERGESG